MRELEEMGRVRGELLRVVYSHLTDEQAAERIGELVRSDRRRADATLRYVRRARDHYCSYETDRAYRVLVAAIEGASPEAVRSEDAGLFERERQLGWTPLGRAFEQLCSMVPELDALRERAERLAAAPESFGIKRDPDGISVPAGVLPDVHADTDRLLGPSSNHEDPLIRSPLARTIVANYVTAVLTHTADRALWDHPAKARVTVTGSFFPGA